MFAQRLSRGSLCNQALKWPPPPSAAIILHLLRSGCSGGDIRLSSPVLPLSFTSLLPSTVVFKLLNVEVHPCGGVIETLARGEGGSHVRLTVHVLMIHQNSRVRAKNPWTGFNEAALAGSTMLEPSFDPKQRKQKNTTTGPVVEKCPQRDSKKQSIKIRLADVCVLINIH